MASINIRYSCGCGYSTEKLEEANKHADSKWHTLTVLGLIEKPKLLPKK